MIQGLSVLAMVWLHLFDKNYSDLFTPLIFVQGTPLSFYIAQLCDFCVFGFAFCSGYGHMAQCELSNFYKRRLKGLFSLLCNYWFILVTFSIVSIFVGNAAQMPGGIGNFILNALTINNSYNGAWWYMFAYIIIVLLSPLLLRVVKKFNPVIVLCIGFIIYCIAYYVRFFLGNVNTNSDILNLVVNWCLAKFGPLGMTLFEYLLGAVCYKFKIFTKIYNIWERLNKISHWIIAIFIVAAMLYCRTKIIPSLFVAPITGFMIIMLFHFCNKPKIICSFFLFLGKHSTNIWLTHMFFYLYIFENFVYIAKYPILIFIFMIVVTLAVSFLINLMIAPLQKLISKI